MLEGRGAPAIRQDVRLSSTHWERRWVRCPNERPSGRPEGLFRAWIVVGAERFERSTS